jgi:peptidoglycan/xylan/chitin deacetylase (PgdA/CDA1 family)
MMSPAKPLATLSLDLDDQWTYMKIHGDPGWADYPSYLDVAVPRILGILERLGLTITFFIVGQDAAIAANKTALASIARAGHEIANHSFKHEPWLHLYSDAEIAAELDRAGDAIEAATGHRPRGFRGPGFSISKSVLEALKQRGYQYDASTFPTYIGPLARTYYFVTSRLPAEERRKRGILFGKLSDGLRPLKAYEWQLGDGPLLEIPVTTMPLIKAPFHPTYILYLAMYSTAAARQYFRTALAACRASGVEPSLLLHPLDFLGKEDKTGLDFFPAMTVPTAKKLEHMDFILRTYASRFEVLPMGAYASRRVERGALRTVTPSFASDARAA